MNLRLVQCPHTSIHVIWVCKQNKAITFPPSSTSSVSILKWGDSTPPGTCKYMYMRVHKQNTAIMGANGVQSDMISSETGRFVYLSSGDGTAIDHRRTGNVGMGCRGMYVSSTDYWKTYITKCGLTLYQPMTHIRIMSSHKPIRIYMEALYTS